MYCLIALIAMGCCMSVLLWQDLMQWGLRLPGQHPGKPGFAHWQCLWWEWKPCALFHSLDKCTVTGGGKGVGQRVFSFSLFLSFVACDLCFAFARSGASALMCVMSDGTQELGCWHRLWYKSQPMGGVIYGKRNEILSYMLDNMLSFYIQYCHLPLYPVAVWGNASYFWLIETYFLKWELWSLALGKPLNY